MIKQIDIKNYKCYENHKIVFLGNTIMVGKNNAGKSTLIEILRILSLIVQRYKTLPYKEPPDWLEISRINVGISPSLKGIDISLENLFFRYSDPPAHVRVSFTSGKKIEIYVGEEGKIHAVLFERNGKIIKNKSIARNQDFPKINILPQIGPLRQEEDLLMEEYVKQSEHTSLSSLHFRNQLQFFQNKYYRIFDKLCQSSWSSLRIRPFERGDRLKQTSPRLMVQEEGFVTEVGNVGHGLQMWLQTMWFLAKCDCNSIIILDEPDVYLHADIQRKLIHVLKNNYVQIIIATHSIEIISEVNPEEILIVDKSKRQSKYALDLPSVQKIINSIGSLQNLELIRYWSSDKFLILEGPKDDIKILNGFYVKMFSKSQKELNILPRIYVEGWAGWQRVLGANLILQENKSVETYCFFDSDYHLEVEKNKRRKEAKDKNINLWIWKRKEIENYLIVPSAICRIINTKKEIALNEVTDKIDHFLEEEKTNIYDCFSTEIHNQNKDAIKKCNTEARKIVNSSWSSFDERITIASGKTILKKICDWTQQEFKLSISKFDILNEIIIEEVDDEIKDVLEKIEAKDKLTI